MLLTQENVALLQDMAQRNEITDEDLRRLNGYSSKPRRAIDPEWEPDIPSFALKKPKAESFDLHATHRYKELTRTMQASMFASCYSSLSVLLCLASTFRSHNTSVIAFAFASMLLSLLAAITSYNTMRNALNARNSLERKTIWTTQKTSSSMNANWSKK